MKKLLQNGFYILVFLNCILCSLKSNTQERCSTRFDTLSLSPATRQKIREFTFAAKQAHTKLLEDKNKPKSAVNTATSRAISENMILIPVAVHVVHNNAAENIPDAQIQSQIDVLNEDFRRRNPDFLQNVPADFRNVAADTRIQFYLACIDPNGNPTNGITRTFTDSSQFSSDFNNMKRSAAGHTNWNPRLYLNLWVCDLSNGGLGFATFPWELGSRPENDGVVIDFQSMGRTGNLNPRAELGRTATHEIGHWLGLFHIWGDDAGSCNGSDEIPDTPNQGPSTPFFSNPTHPRPDNCTNMVMFQNYMDYSADRFMGLFTEGQNARMQTSFTFYRSNFQSYLISGDPNILNCNGGQFYRIEGSNLPANSLINWTVSANLEIMSGQGTSNVQVRQRNGGVEPGFIEAIISVCGRPSVSLPRLGLTASLCNLSTNVTSLSFPNQGGNQTLVLSTTGNIAWGSGFTDFGWLSNNPVSGGTGTFNINISANANTGSNRAQTMTIEGTSSGNYSRVLVDISQAGNPPDCNGNGNFTGYLDEANCNTISGWALDQSNFGRTLQVEIRVDGQLVATIPANGSRPDLVGAFGNNPQAQFHGYSYAVPANASWRNGQNRSITARICGANNDLWSSPKTVNCTGGGGGGGFACNFSTSATVNNANVGCSGSITLNAPCSGPDCGGVSYVWSGNGLYQTSQSTNTNAPNANGSYTYYVQANKTGCSTQNNSVAVNVSGCGGGGSSTCSAENDQCSGNSSEVRNYSISASAGGSYTIKAFYRSHEGPGVIRWSVNGGAVQTMNVAQTSVNNYPEVTLGTATLNAGNNTVNLSSGGGFVCFRKACIEGGGGGAACNFSTSATVNNANVGCSGGITLNAPCSGPDCGGVSYVWSGNGLYQTSQSTNTNAPNANGSYTYYVQASKTGCSTQNNSVVVNVSGCGGGGGSSNCSAENDQCSGNSSEVRNYSVSASMSGIYTIKVFYRSHEGPGVIRWSVDGGAVQTLNVAQTAVNNYPEITLGTANLSSGNHTINLSSGGGFVCFRKVCIQSGARVGVAENLEEPSDIVVYPNPTSGELTLQLFLENRSDVQLYLHDLTGRRLWQSLLSKREGKVQEKLWLGEVSAGFYLLTVQTNERSWTQKVVLQK